MMTAKPIDYSKVLGYYGVVREYYHSKAQADKRNTELEATGKYVIMRSYWPSAKYKPYKLEFFMTKEAKAEFDKENGEPQQ